MLIRYTLLFFSISYLLSCSGSEDISEISLGASTNNEIVDVEPAPTPNPDVTAESTPTPESIPEPETTPTPEPSPEPIPIPEPIPTPEPTLSSNTGSNTEILFEKQSACVVEERDGNTFIIHNEFTWQILGVNHTTGKYLSGDCWIQGPVTIENVSPAAFANSNGSMVNPAAGPNAKQAYEGGVASYDQSLAVSYPFIAPPNTSLVSSLTNPTFVGTDNRYGWILAHGILTVTESSVSDNSFRPPYSALAEKKPAYAFTFNDVDLSFLPYLAFTGETKPDPVALLLETARPWIDHLFEYPSRALHAVNNMPGYGANLTSTVAATCLGTSLDWDESYRQELAINLIQLGIDNYGLVEAGQYFPANGGHMSGRLLPILFAGKALNDDDMLHVTERDFPIEHGFAENCQTYGTGQYGIRYCSRGDTSTRYVSVNSPTWVGEATCARALELEQAWNHAPFFDYVESFTQSENFGDVYDLYDYFHAEMWLLYGR